MSVMNLEGEIWKDIVIDSETYPYQISNYGRVKSVKFAKEKLMTLTKEKSSYLRICLCRNGKKKSFFVHRLLATAFLPNPNGLPCINHKIEGEEGKSMNFVFFKANGEVDEERTTIEWVTHKENTNYATCIERRAKKRKETIKTSVVWAEGIAKANARKRKPVYQYDQNFELLNVFESLTAASKQTTCDYSNISACCLGKIKTAYGYIWSYEPIETSSNQLTLFTETNVS